MQLLYIFSKCYQHDTALQHDEDYKHSRDREVKVLLFQ